MLIPHRSNLILLPSVYSNGGDLRKRVLQQWGLHTTIDVGIVKSCSKYISYLSDIDRRRIKLEIVKILNKRVLLVDEAHWILLKLKKEEYSQLSN